MLFKGQLYPFQSDVLEWAKERERGILGLDMGLGKTVITIAIMCHCQPLHSLVVVPRAILEQWRASLLRFTELTNADVCIYQGHSRHNLPLEQSRVVITTYDLIRYDLPDPQSGLSRVQNMFDAVFFDEAHVLRNQDTSIHRWCAMLADNVTYAWGLTGTVIHNKLTDYTNLCDLLHLPHDKDAYICLKKEDCDLSLPPKVLNEHQLIFDETHGQEYSSLVMGTKKMVLEYNTAPTAELYRCLLVKILRLRQSCNHVDAILDDATGQISSNCHDINTTSVKFVKILELINATQDKVIIFSQWTYSLNLLSRFLNQQGHSCLIYNGQQTTGDHSYVLRQFKEVPQNRILLITLASGGVGLDMSFANHVILLDSWWNTALEDQAIDRVYRIGQTRPVSVHRLRVKNTIEDWMFNLKQQKNLVAQCFHENGDFNKINQSLLREIFTYCMSFPTVKSNVPIKLEVPIMLEIPIKLEIPKLPVKLPKQKIPIKLIPPVKSTDLSLLVPNHLMHLVK